MQMTFDIDRRDLNRRLHLQEEENIKAAAVRTLTSTVTSG